MATLIYVQRETAITFGDSGQSAVLTMQNVAAGVGRISAQVDRGAGAKAREYEILCKFEKGVASVVGEVIPIYIARGDGTYVEGNVGTADAALTAAQAAGLMPVGPVNITTTATNTPIVGVFSRVFISARYFSVGYINSTTGLLRNTANSGIIIVTPMPDELQ